VIAHDRADYAHLAEYVTVARVIAFFGFRIKGTVERYELPNTGALASCFTMH